MKNDNTSLQLVSSDFLIILIFPPSLYIDHCRAFEEDLPFAYQAPLYLD